jgi:protoporphyrinogen oxidase
MQRYDVAVLGCGWTGVLVSYFILRKKPGLSIVCIDRSTALGGLMRSEVVEGFTFDVGGSHIIFSKDKEVLSKMLSFLGNNVVSHRRKSFIRMDGTFVPYPFENGIYVLPSETRANILTAFIESMLERLKSCTWEPKNLREWIYGFFGREIARMYLEPYNQKIWKRDLDRIDVDWIYTPGRLPIPDWRDLVHAAVGIPTEGYREQARFYYPRRGGIQSLYEAVLNRVLESGKAVVLKGEVVDKIRLTSDNRWIINDNIEAKKIVSTIPPNELLSALDAPEHVLRAANKLDYNSVIVVGMGLKRPAPDMHWIYVPSNDIIFHRYAWISNYSPDNVPRKDYSSLILEITIPRWEKIDKDKIIDKVVNDVEKLGIVNSRDDEILFTRAWIHKYGYPVYTIGHRQARETIFGYLNEIGIVSVGRWGMWHYWNMDRIYKEVKEIIEDMLFKDKYSVEGRN